MNEARRGFLEYRDVAAVELPGWECSLDAQAHAVPELSFEPS